MAHLASKSIVDAAVTRIRQIAPISTAWGPSNAFSAITIVQPGDLAYLPERPDLLSDLPAVFCKIDGAVDIELESMTGDQFNHTYNVRCVYVRAYDRATDDPWEIKREETVALADAFLDSAVLNGISTDLFLLVSATTTSVDYDPQEDVLLAALGRDDIFATAFTVEVVGLSQT